MSCRKSAGLLAAVILFALDLRRAGAVDSLPTSWRQGIATNYGGAQDGKVSPLVVTFGTASP